VSTGLLLAGTDERHADADQSIVEGGGQRIHTGNCGEGDRSKCQSIFDYVLTVFLLDQALHPREHPQFEPPLRSFLCELPVLVCLEQGEQA
jgi:hypothetical protein